ncbi:hypothetical protein MFERI14815_00207 [Mycoplasma feriruminatoris]|uniref:hypothetical protein n=1 Tax=Mycoplasma feriruminatoris TaxID=1179777 RepID=UPI00241CBB81|nr:hypothetical protein [Mycoplasma feriruminatoris]WFQ91607.1 hypothetical protein MFERI14815_00207 [Mycoplasma feriruminatoris]
MEKNKSSNNLILAGGIVSVVGSIVSVFVVGYLFYINIAFSAIFPFFGQIFKTFLNFIGLGLAITSLVLGILALVPKFTNNKKLIITAGVFNVAFGLIAGGVLLIVGWTNMPTSITTNTNMQMTNEPVKQETTVENNNQVNNLQTKELSNSLKITKKPFNYKALILSGLIIILINSIIGLAITSIDAKHWTSYWFGRVDLNSPYRYHISNTGLLPHIYQVYVIPSFYCIQIIMSIVGLSTIKKNSDMFLIFISAISIFFAYPIIVNSAGGLLVLVGVIIKKIIESKTEIIEKV